jgi:SpoVK/Ycf46/Vps4 family AAA+-type ATPase
VKSDLFELVLELPDTNQRRRYDSLVGLDEVKGRLLREAQILLDTAALEKWSVQFHGDRLPVCDAMSDRPPMFLFAGDVGTGKTVLAESFGDEIARRMKRQMLLFRLSLSSRGSGAVGEMTQLLAAAFDEVRSTARGGAGVIMLIDEADALAQSREAAQMHHEDRAGVNALIRGLNSLTEQHLPVLVVLATNRIGAIDPAVRRRAAAVFTFERPNSQQRQQALEALTGGLGLGQRDITRLVELTGPTEARRWGFTFSDLYLRLLPTAVLAAFPDRPLTADILMSIAEDLVPTPPFVEQE